MLRPLTALRFVFALMVFASHCVVFMPGGRDAHPFLHSLLFEGFIGVSFFFVLSGFILAYRYANGVSSGTIRLRTFTLRRISRIYPLYLFCLLLTAALHFQYLQREPGNYIRDLALHITMLQTIVDGGRHAFVFNGPAWSVADEMFFYLLFPFLVRLMHLPPLRNAIVILPAAAVIVAMLLSSGPPSSYIFYSNPVIRLVDFMLGIALFRIYAQVREMNWAPMRATILELGSLLLLAAFVMFREQAPLFWRYSTFYWLPMMLLTLIFAIGRGRISRMLSHELPVKLGEASYAFYLFHTPAAILLGIAFRRLGLVPSPLVFVFSYFIFTLTGSLLLHRYLELPLTRRLRRRFIDRPGAA